MVIQYWIDSQLKCDYTNRKQKKGEGESCKQAVATHTHFYFHKLHF